MHSRCVSKRAAASSYSHGTDHSWRKLSSVGMPATAAEALHPVARARSGTCSCAHQYVQTRISHISRHQHARQLERHVLARHDHFLHARPKARRSRRSKPPPNLRRWRLPSRPRAALQTSANPLPRLRRPGARPSRPRLATSTRRTEFEIWASRSPAQDRRFPPSPSPRPGGSSRVADVFLCGRRCRKRR